MDFGGKVRAAREDRDMSQQEIAQLIPMNQSNYSKIERNLQEPSLYQLKRIVEILNIDLYAILDLPPRNHAHDADRRFMDGVLRLYRSIYPGKP